MVYCERKNSPLGLLVGVQNILEIKHQKSNPRWIRVDALWLYFLTSYSSVSILLYLVESVNDLQARIPDPTRINSRAIYKGLRPEYQP